MKHIIYFTTLIYLCFALSASQVGAQQRTGEQKSQRNPQSTSKSKKQVDQGQESREKRLNVKTTGGRTALMLAAARGQLDVVKALLKRGTNVDAKDSVNGMTALMFAAIGGDPVIVNLLLEKGAKPDFASLGGISVLTFAAVGRPNSNQTNQRMVFETLLAKVDAIVAARDKGSRIYPLREQLIASKRCHGEMITFMDTKVGKLSRSDIMNNLNEVLNSEWIPEDVDRMMYILGVKDLWTAAMLNDAVAIKASMKKGEDMNVKNNCGQTPLMIATKHKRQEIIELLKDVGEKK